MFALAFVPAAFAAPSDCDLIATKVDSVVNSDGQTTKFDLATDGYDPVPMLSKRFEVTSKDPSCVMAQLSLHSLEGWGFGDEYTAVEVRIDGVLMWGHTSWCSTKGVNVHCLALENQNDGLTPINAHAYHLVLPDVAPGWHTIEVRYAGLDVTNTPEFGAYVGGAALSVHHE